MHRSGEWGLRITGCGDVEANREMGGVRGGGIWMTGLNFINNRAMALLNSGD